MIIIGQGPQLTVNHASHHGIDMHLRVRVRDYVRDRVRVMLELGLWSHETFFQWFSPVVVVPNVTQFLVLLHYVSHCLRHLEVFLLQKTILLFLLL
jgi:hypothetical protein